MGDSTLKPFHESIVDAINRASGSFTFEHLAQLIKETKIPKGHDAIIDAWNTRVLEVGLNSDLGVPESVAAQKPPVEAVAE